jgi:pyrimidine operon attenuation protein/uracil phosphoribosyltransferase
LTSSIQLDAEALYVQLREGVGALLAVTPKPAYLAGITSGGAWLAERLQRDLGLDGDAGVISSSMHRDDFAQRGLALSAQTVLPFDVNGAHVILVDDVLYTGRTIRAVLNELYDYGRPATVQLAVLVDRAGRELPVQASFKVTTLSLPEDQLLELAKSESNGQLSFVLEKKKLGA